MAWMNGEYDVSEGISTAVAWIVEEVMAKQKNGKVHINIEGCFDGCGSVTISEPKLDSEKGQG